ncbi:helix-turn-helix domain-containing protein [Streptomyces sp. B1866]|uniref:TetR/AcrR family transcriptional regulator n=1 Tax=Streptomyces sp. B1866 TaxID=3075431 RepID=UPI0028918EE5|nr:helix-turn-helix domain-containing protein [Streptomyces sp. B1866]MDT3396290.1 helix-turn-helix domain-containing protein [Streptomyces sp. B1866]
MASGEATVPRRADARRNRARILAAAEAVFAEKGESASTEEVARRAGVAVGTVFRHFPTKSELVEAILMGVLQRLMDHAEALHRTEPAEGLFLLYRDVVAQASAQRSVIDLMFRAEGVRLTTGVSALRKAVGVLLDDARRAGSVRPDVALDEVMALLAALSEGAVSGEWGEELRQRTLAVVFAGLRA